MHRIPKVAVLILAALFLIPPVSGNLGLTHAQAQAQTQAQTPAPQGKPTRVRGTVDKLDGDILTVKARDGQIVTVALQPKFAVRGVVKRSLADVKLGDYVASTSVKGTDGKLHAVEVHIFPEALRGASEGQFPWDLVPDSLMTNATVVGMVAGSSATTLRVAYKGSISEIAVAPDVPVVGYVPADASLLKPGAAVFIVAFRHPDGSLTSAGVTAEKDGVKPPM